MGLLGGAEKAVEGEGTRKHGVQQGWGTQEARGSFGRCGPETAAGGGWEGVWARWGGGRQGVEAARGKYG